MSINRFNIGEFIIVDTALASASTTFTIASSKRNRKGQDDITTPQYYEFPKLTYVDFRLTIVEKGGARVEVIGCASVVDANNDLSDGRKRYTITIGTYDDASLWRGVKQDESGTNAIANKDADLIVDNFPVGSLCKIAWDVAELTSLDNAFRSNTTQIDDAVSGEAFSILDQLSLHTDRKWYKYDSINYPDWRGTAGFTATGVDEIGTVFLPGYIVPGYIGLTIGDTVYADNGGTTVQVETATSAPIGYAASATELRLQSLVGAQAATSFEDSEFEVKNTADQTKKLNTDISGNATGIETTIATASTSNETFTHPDKAGAGGTYAMTSDISTFISKNAHNFIIAEEWIGVTGLTEETVFSLLVDSTTMLYGEVSVDVDGSEFLAPTTGTSVIRGVSPSSSIVATVTQDGTFHTTALDKTLVTSGDGLASAQGIFMKPDGTKLYITDDGDAAVYQYTLSTPYDITSGTLDGTASVAANASSVNLSSDGTRLFINQATANDFFQYDLTTPWDVTGVVTGAGSISLTKRNGAHFSSDGVYLFATELASGLVQRYTMSTPWDITTALVSGSFTPGTALKGVSLNSDGTKIYTSDETGSLFRLHNLSTPWLLSSASANGSFDFSTETAITRDIFLLDDLTGILKASDSPSQYEYNLDAIAGETNVVIL